MSQKPEAKTSKWVYILPPIMFVGLIGGCAYVNWQVDYEYNKPIIEHFHEDIHGATRDLKEMAITVDIDYQSSKHEDNDEGMSAKVAMTAIRVAHSGIADFNPKIRIDGMESEIKYTIQEELRQMHKEDNVTATNLRYIQ